MLWQQNLWFPELCFNWGLVWDRFTLCWLSDFVLAAWSTLLVQPVKFSCFRSVRSTSILSRYQCVFCVPKARYPCKVMYYSALSQLKDTYVWFVTEYVLCTMVNRLTFYFIGTQLFYGIKSYVWSERQKYLCIRGINFIQLEFWPYICLLLI